MDVVWVIVGLGCEEIRLGLSHHPWCQFVWIGEPWELYGDLKVARRYKSSRKSISGSHKEQGSRQSPGNLDQAGVELVGHEHFEYSTGWGLDDGRTELQ